MYSDKVIDHFTNPRNVGEIENADGIGEKVSSSCGDRMKVFLKVEGDIIEDVKFQTYGCGAAIASSSMMSELVIGKTLQEALDLTNDQVADALGGLPAPKLHCSNLAADALHEAIKNYQENNA